MGDTELIWEIVFRSTVHQNGRDENVSGRCHGYDDVLA